MRPHPFSLYYVSLARCGAHGSCVMGYGNHAPLRLIAFRLFAIPKRKNKRQNRSRSPAGCRRLNVWIIKVRARLLTSDLGRDAPGRPFGPGSSSLQSTARMGCPREPDWHISAILWVEDAPGVSIGPAAIQHVGVALRLQKLLGSGSAPSALSVYDDRCSLVHGHRRKWHSGISVEIPKEGAIGSRLQLSLSSPP